MLPKLALLAGSAFIEVAAEVTFINTSFDIEQGTPFTLRYRGCDDGCTINLMTGASNNLKVEKVLTTSATGESYTFTLSGLDAGTYAFKITNGQDISYSSQFELEGDPSESETTGSSQGGLGAIPVSESKSTSTSTPTSTASSASITSSGSSTNSQDAVTSTSSGTSSTLSTAAQATTTAPSPPKHGLSTGAIAGIVVGVVAVILIVLGALFYWMRRRRKEKATRGPTSNTDPRDLQPQIAELEQPKQIDIVVTPATPAEMRGSTPPPPAAELTGQGRLRELPSTEKATEKELEGDVAAIVPELQGEEKRVEKELEGDVARTVPELQGEEKALPVELPAQTARKDNEQQKQLVALPTELPTFTKEPQKETGSPPAAQTQTDASVSAPKSPSDAESTPVTEAISPVSPVSDEASHAMLMEQYAQLEARRQRILELKTIEEEQAALRARLSKMQGGNGTE